jgi:hypothetical protein
MQSQSQSQSQSQRYDSRAALLHAAERELREALIEQERSRGGLYLQASPEADAALDRAVRAVCDEAHRLNMRAEDLLIALKQAWSHLATTRARHLGDRDGDVLRGVVSTSIEVFFEPDPEPRQQERR